MTWFGCDLIADTPLHLLALASGVSAYVNMRNDEWTMYIAAWPQALKRSIQKFAKGKTPCFQSPLLIRGLVGKYIITAYPGTSIDWLLAILSQFRPHLFFLLGGGGLLNPPNTRCLLVTCYLPWPLPQCRNRLSYLLHPLNQNYMAILMVFQMN